MRRLTLILLSSVALLSCAKKEAAAPAQEETSQAASEATRAAETARLNAWFEARWTEELAFSPLRKTQLGIKDADYSKIDDFTEAGQDLILDWRRKAVAEMRAAFDREALTDDGRVSFDVFEELLLRAERAEPFRRRGYIFTQMNGAHTSLPNALINFHKVDAATDMDAYVARISGVGRAVRENLERAKLAAGEGVHAPLFAYEAVGRQAKALITGAPFAGDGDSPLFADAKTKVSALRESGAIDAAQADAFLAAAQKVLIDDFKPAYEALIAFVEADSANSPKVATGVRSLPDGEAYYQERLAFSTTTTLTADEIHQIGLDEVARIRGEMEAIKAKVGFEGALDEFFAFVRDDPRFYYPNTDEGREQYLQAARDKLAFIKTRLPDFFGVLPKADLVVKRVEPFRETPGGAQHYNQGTPDGSRPGVFYAHLSDMASMPIPQIEVIAYHEGNPGHHMQRSIAQETAGLPQFRAQAGFTAFTEGWALYSEPLAKEMGAYEDPYSDFGRLTTEIWRAIRLVVDTGLHAKGWTEDEAVAYFTANSPAATGQIRSEVRRYIVTPGQATAYKIGMLKIQELRRRGEGALGDQFDIRGFHDLILGGGAVPLSILERRIDGWVAARKAG